MKFKLVKDSKLSEILLFDNDIELHKITPLMGANSVGKSSLKKLLLKALDFIQKTPLE